jgi:hypothetical protein
VLSADASTGRVPNTRGLGLEDAGVKLGSKGEVVVDEYSRTNVPSIWAVGDVTNRIQVGSCWGQHLCCVCQSSRALLPVICQFPLYQKVRRVTADVAAILMIPPSCMCDSVQRSQFSDEILVDSWTACCLAQRGLCDSVALDCNPSQCLPARCS